MSTRKIKIAFIGGGSQNWAPHIIRDIIFKPGMEKVHLDIHLLDIDMPRANAIKALFDKKISEWAIDRVSITSTNDSEHALEYADFVIIAISTGRLEAMSHDLAIPEKYGVYHTVGDTTGPGGWSRAIRNIPVFKAYAQQIRRLAPNAYVLNYTNPLAVLTKILTRYLGKNRVVGLCHGLFESYDVLKTIFSVEEKDIQVRFGGLNHFFWILDFKVNGQDGYKLLDEKMHGRNFAELVKETHVDSMGWSSDKWLAGELFENFGYLPYVGDRHTCEFFNCYMTNPELMQRFKLVRTTIADRENYYIAAAERIRKWTAGEEADSELTQEPSRETAADTIKAITFNEGFTDVVNMVNGGQIPYLPFGAVVETMGHIDGSGFTPLVTGAIPGSILSVMQPHAEVQKMTAETAFSGNENDALMALVADPICSHLTPTDIKKMGRELIKANRQFVDGLLEGD